MEALEALRTVLGEQVSEATLTSLLTRFDHDVEAAIDFHFSQRRSPSADVQLQRCDEGMARCESWPRGLCVTEVNAFSLVKQSGPEPPLREGEQLAILLPSLTASSQRAGRQRRGGDEVLRLCRHGEAHTLLRLPAPLSRCLAEGRGGFRAQPVHAPGIWNEMHRELISPWLSSCIQTT